MVRLEQIEAAQRLFAKMAGWQYAVKTLDSIRQDYPDFGGVECFIKTVAVNGLYSTNLYDVGLMARHITDLFRSARESCSAGGPVDTELVKKTANLKYRNGNVRRHVSFASKFCHFFISGDFPILDKYAVAALMLHDELFSDQFNDGRYSNYVSSFNRVLPAGHSARELDRYLWLRGMLLALRENPDAEVSGEFKGVVEEGGADIGILSANA